MNCGIFAFFAVGVPQGPSQRPEEPEGSAPVGLTWGIFFKLAESD